MPTDRPLLLALIPIAYLLGSIPFGILFARLIKGTDPRLSGSGNIGATNVGRTAGKTAGLLTLAADIVKGAVPVFAAFRLEAAPLLVSLTALAAFLGHLFPVFARFRGGKGVATALGVMLVVAPLATLLSAAVFAAAVAAKRYVSLGSILAAALLPVFLAFLRYRRDYVVLGIAIGALVIIKHWANIKRLASGTENRL